MSKKMWGGRFKKEVDEDFFSFQKSIQYDYKLAAYDILHSLVHINALQSAHLITAAEKKKLHSALMGIAKQIRQGKFKPDLDAEDIHTQIQNKVQDKLGSIALKLHTLRSRNDQVVFDEKHYCGVEAGGIAALLDSVILTLKSLGARHKGVYIPGYTHTQRAQKVGFADYLSALACMFEADKKKLITFADKLVVYIGSGAFKGTSLAKEYARAITGEIKRLSALQIKVADEPIANVSDRDFIIEFLSIISIIQMHLSRLAEDFILYSTREFDYFDLPEEFCTGSSLMPHKKNPDFLELVRGYTGRIYGNLVSLLTTMKGLPLTYNRDMQLDKEPLFSSVEIIRDELRILARFIKGIKLNKAAIDKALEDDCLYAVDLAEYLVREKKAAFKDAHDIVGKLIRYCEDNDCRAKDVPAGTLKKLSPYLDKRAIGKILE